MALAITIRTRGVFIPVTLTRSRLVGANGATAKSNPFAVKGAGDHAVEVALGVA